MSTVRSALIQTYGSMSMEENVERQIALIEQAAEQGAQITCLQELATGPYFCQVQDPKYYELRRASSRRPDRQAHAGTRQEARDGARRAALRDGADRRLLQHRRRDRRRRHLPRQVSQDAHPAGQGLLGEVLLPSRQPGLSRLPDTLRAHRRLHLLRPPLPRRRARLGLNGAEIVYIPSATSRGLSMHLWKIEQVSHAIANGYWVGTINRVGVEPLGDDDFYGTSYFVNARGEIVAEASDKEEEVLVADLDLDKNREVRNVWQFYRDRRPDQYGPLVEG